MAMRLVAIGWLGCRFLMNFCCMVLSRSMMLFLIRLAPLLYRRMFVWLLGMCSRLLIGGFLISRLRNTSFLMGMNLGGNRLRLFYMGLCDGMMVLDGFGSNVLMRHGRFGGWLPGRRQRLGMFGFDLDDRSFEFVELAAQHFLGRARLHALELPLHGTTSSIVDLDPHLGIVFRQAVNGPSNDCYKIRHQHFLMIPGKQPGRDSSLIRNFSPQRGLSQVWYPRAPGWSKAWQPAHRSILPLAGHT